MDLLIPADIEYAVQGWIKSVFTAQSWGSPIVSTSFKDGDAVVVAFSTGGSNRTLVSGGQRIMFDCYAKREAQAWGLASKVYAAIADLDSRRVEGVQFYDVEPTLPANYPHPDRPDYFRYQFNAVIHARHMGTN